MMVNGRGDISTIREMEENTMHLFPWLIQTQWRLEVMSDFHYSAKRMCGQELDDYIKQSPVTGTLFYFTKCNLLRPFLFVSINCFTLRNRVFLVFMPS